MKTRTFFMLSALVMVMGTLLFSCDNKDDKKYDEGQKDLTIGEADNTDTEYLEDIERYRTEADEQFEQHDSILDAFRARLEHEKNEVNRMAWEAETVELEKRNEEMRAKLRDYKAENRTRWEEFKEEFKHDMDELGDALRDLGVDNK